MEFNKRFSWSFDTYGKKLNRFFAIENLSAKIVLFI